MKQLLFSVLSTSLFFFFSCKKSNDTSEPVPQLSVSPTNIVLKGNAGAIDSFSISYSGDWTLSVNPSTASWLKLSSAGGIGNKKIYTTVEATYISASDRTVTIIVTPTGNTSQHANITVKQKPYVFIPWRNVYGGTKAEVFSDLVSAPDGSFVAVGSAESNDGDVSVNRGSRDLWVVKVNAEGTKLWEKTFGGSGDDAANNVIATADGGYLIAGYTGSNDGDVTSNHGLNDFWLVKIDDNGNKVWQKNYGGSGDDGALSVTKTGNGYLIAGYTSSPDGDVGGYHATPGSNAGDVWLVSIDQNGNILWQKAYGGSDQEAVLSVIATSDNGYIVSGWSNAGTASGDVVPTHGSMDMWIFKINASGGLLWQRLYGGKNLDLASGIAATTDGGFIIAGYLSDDIIFPRNQDAGITKVDANGDLVWQKKLGGSKEDGGWSVVPAADGGYIVAGYTSSVDGNVSGNLGKADAWVIKLSSQGDMVWQKTFGGSDTEVSTAIRSIGNDAYAVAGYTLSSDHDISGQHGSYDAWLFTFKDQ